MKIFYILIASIFLPHYGVCQIEKRNFFPTPNAAGLGMYNQIPVDNFTGTPQIEIPLYTYKSRDLSVPIELTYHSSNIKPSDHASWVGLGWSLQAGGVITRIQNDIPDEYIDFDHPGAGSFANREKRGFFYTYSYMNDNNWLGSTFNQEANSFFQTGVEDYSWYEDNELYRRDLAPDEFQFNFLGMSGSLFMGQDGQWKLKSKNGYNFTVSMEIGNFHLVEPSTAPGYNSFIKNCINKIILTASDGTQYTFGGDNSSVEFVRVGIGTFSIAATRDGGTIPSSWYLTDIKSQSGDEISFSYVRDGFQIMNQINGIGYTYLCPKCSPESYYYTGPGIALTDNLQILSGVSLASIKGANGTITFQSSKASILDFQLQNFNPLSFPSFEMFSSYGYEVFNGSINTAFDVANLHSTYKKLDQISILDNSNALLKSYQFAYLNVATNRLFLTSLTELGSDGTAISPYTFSYNNKEGLNNVPYETTKIDHWGFFTNTDPLTGLVFNPIPGTYGSYNITQTSNQSASDGSDFISTAFDNTFKTTYFNNRNPNSNASTGILQSIIYPTGGSVQFAWQPNLYSKTIDQSPVNNSPNITVLDNNGDLPGPGSRIYTITRKAGFNIPDNIITYNYYRDYVNHTSYLSSGVLNSSIPNYVDYYQQINAFQYNLWATQNRVPLHYTNGSPITYSIVQEINSDGSFKQYTYKNHDNGYLDQLPSAYAITNYGNSSFQEYNTTSLELERGQLLNELSYKQGNTLLKSISYNYNSDPNRFNSNIRRYEYDNKFTLDGTVSNFQPVLFMQGNPVYSGANVTALLIYYYYPFVQTITETNYDQNGANPVTTVTSYTYDSYRNKKSENFINSKSETVSQNYNYCNDNISGLSIGATNAILYMSFSNMVSNVLEKITTKNSLQAEHSRVDYQQYQNLNNLIVPANSFISVNGNPLDNLTQYINFDNKSNILEYITRDGIPVSFDWGYNLAYPTVRIENATNTLKTTVTSSNTTASNNINLSVGGGAGSSAYSEVTFIQTSTGNITLTLGNTFPSNANVTCSYSLTGPGPTNLSGSLCISNSVTSCGSIPSTITFPNLPNGQYTLTFSANTNFSSYSFGATLNYSYASTTVTSSTTGIKEFFYDGFEENTNSNVIIGAAHTGQKYYNSNYTTSFVQPDSRNYSIEWWNLVSGSWNYNLQNYTSGMVLTGPVDDIRIFPSDNCLMNTYTYTPLIGITSEIAPNNKVTFYEYDVFGRLKLIRDKDRNIIKQFDYQYQQQP